MKKLTIQQFAQTIRKKYPGKYDDIDDNGLVFKWLKKYYADSKYIQNSELAKLGYNEAGKLVSKGKDYVKDKTKDLIPSDSTQQSIKDKVGGLIDKVNDGNWLQTVTDKIKQAKEKVTTNTQQSTTEPTSQEKKVAPAYSSTFKSKPCDENTYPWTRGCKNNKIGQMNQIYFGDRYGDIYGDDLYYRLESLGYFYKTGEKEGEISKAIYDGVLKDSLQENEFSHRKKIVKETVKNVLKQRFNKK